MMMTTTVGDVGISNTANLDAFYPEMKRIELQFAGRTVYVETGRLARSAAGSVLVQSGDTIVMVNVTRSSEPRKGIDFFPLMVDFEEKMFAVGRIPGSFNRREGRPSEKAILISRLIDRPIRPLFPDGYRNDVQIQASVLTCDGVVQPDMLAMLGASFALVLAKDIPFLGPIGAVRVARLNGSLIANPTQAESDASDLDLVVAGTKDSVMMVEAGADFVDEATLVAALNFAQGIIVQQVEAQEAFAQQCGLELNVPFTPAFDNTPLYTFIKGLVLDQVSAAYHNFNRDERQALLKAAKDTAKEAFAALAEDHELKQLVIAQDGIDVFSECFKKVEKHVMRGMVVNEGVRADGRKVDEIRPIKCHVGVLPQVHGSALFTRGSTQALCIATLGSPGDAQSLDTIHPETSKRWMHHYSFPPFSVGEAKPLRSPGRREIGHGALAERAVEASLPSQEAFPYTLRVNSEVVESNGSTSMASTCGATLALMDAGVPLKDVVGGIAMGLIKEGDTTVVLSDIQGVEDFLGDMDFKVTGSEKGITALQMDIKIQGISVELMSSALEQARLGRLHILGKMKEAIAAPRTELSSSAPRIISVRVDQDQIGTVIGPGGKMIRSIIEETGAQIDIADDGLVTITSKDGGGEVAKAKIEALTKKILPGEIYKGTVLSMIPIGAFVQLAPGKDGMIHISQFPYRINQIEDLLTVGDEILVEVKEVDERGRINLTVKTISDEQRAEYGLPPFPTLPEGYEFNPNAGGDRGGRPPRREGGGGGYDRDRGSRPPRREGGGGGGRY